MTEHDIETIRAVLRDALAPTESRLGTIEATLAEHTNAIALLRQDAGLIRTGQDGQMRLLDMLLQDMRMMRGAVNDIARENVTPGEVEAIHHDLNRMQRELAELHVAVDGMRRS